MKIKRKLTSALNAIDTAITWLKRSRPDGGEIRDDIDRAIRELDDAESDLRRAIRELPANLS